MEVKRFSVGRFSGFGDAHPLGCWVRFEDFDRVTAERDALQQRLNAVEEENDRLRAVEAAAKEMLRIAGIAKQGSNAYNRAIINLHQALENRS